MELFKFQIPLASRPNDSVKGVAKFCNHCNKEIILKSWHSWNNFLVKCPFCNKVTGVYWWAKKVLLISFFIHAFSFFFTMRFSNALITFIGFVILAIGGNYILTKEFLPQLLEIFGVVLFLLAPMIINGIVLLKHNSYVQKVSNKERMREIKEVVQDLVS